MPLPIVPIALAGAAIGLYIATKGDSSVRTTPLAPTDPRTKPQTPPIQNQDGQPRVSNAPTTGPMPQAIDIAKTVAGNVITIITPVNPDTGKPTVTAQLAQTGIAVVPAHALYDYLKMVGSSPSPELGIVTTAFQKAHNSDPNGVKTAGVLPETGQYDLPTSAALTVYTGNVVPPSPGSPLVNGGGMAGPAALTGSNLYAYLKKHPLSKTDTTQKDLTLQFQKAVNTDEKYPGPASPFPTARLIKEKLVEDGAYGPKTSDALAVVSFERIPADGSTSVTGGVPATLGSPSAAGALDTYFKAHGNDGSATLKALTSAFQTFANGTGRISPKLVVDGLWGPKTQAALATLMS